MKPISNTYRFFALFMALVMFTSSVNLAVDMHFCQGKLKTVSLIGKAKTCHEIATSTTVKQCPNHQLMTTEKEGCSIDQKSCCHNKTVLLDADQNQDIQAVDVVISQQLQQFVAVCVAVLFTNNLNIESDNVAFADYQPPFIPRDIPVLIQSFLL